MSRQDFEFIAATLRKRAEEVDNRPTVRLLAQDFARELAATNPRFDAARFMEACGL